MSTVTKPFKVQAREIVRFARRNGLILTRGGTGYYKTCVRGVLRNSLLSAETWKDISIYNPIVEEVFGLSSEDASALEEGFEGYPPLNSKWGKAVRKNRYYKVGQNVARLAGLD